MKKWIFLVLCLTMVQISAEAQIFSWGLRGGVSTPDVQPSDLNPITIRNSPDSFRMAVDNANYGWHFGAYARVKLASFYIQPELIFNSSNVTYKLTGLNPRNTFDSLRTETYRNLDIPILLGFKAGGFRINAGPVGHLHIGSSSELTDYRNYEAKFAQMTWGYQAGLGFDLGRLGIDLRYEGNFTKFGDHIQFGNTRFNFGATPSRMIASAAFRF